MCVHLLDLEISCARWACALGNAKFTADSHLQILGVSRMRTWKPQLQQDSHLRILGLSRMRTWKPQVRSVSALQNSVCVNFCTWKCHMCVCWVHLEFASASTFALRNPRYTESASSLRTREFQVRWLRATRESWIHPPGAFGNPTCLRAC